MKQKNASPGKEHAAAIRRHGLNGLLWVVVKDKRHYLVIKHRITGEFKVIEK